MAKISNAILTAVVLLILRLQSADASVCINENPCLCQIDDYKKIDLTPIAKNFQKTDFLEDDSGDYRYFFHGCEDGEFNATAHGVINATTNITQVGSLIEVHSNSTAANVTVLGKKANIVFAAVEGKKDSYKIVYKSGERVIADVNLVCVQDDHSNIKIDENSIKTPLLFFTLYSPFACIQTHHPGMSAGSVLCIIFFISLSVYLIGGALVLYFIRGARGLELIPNIDFWRSLPGLVKDGIIFLFSGCNASAISTPETYDRI